MLKASRISLKPLEERHLETTLSFVNNREIMLKINRVLPVTMLEHREWYSRIVTDKSQLVFAIETNDCIHVGNCGLKNIDPRSRKAELWIYLGLEYTVNKYGKEAIELLLEYGFYDINLNRIYLYVMDDNQVGQKFFSNIGFVKEGVFRQDVFLNGAYHDTIRMSLLKNEFNKRND